MASVCFRQGFLPALPAGPDLQLSAQWVGRKVLFSWRTFNRAIDTDVQHASRQLTAAQRHTAVVCQSAGACEPIHKHVPIVANGSMRVCAIADTKVITVTRPCMSASSPEHSVASETIDGLHLRARRACANAQKKPLRHLRLVSRVRLRAANVSIHSNLSQDFSMNKNQTQGAIKNVAGIIQEKAAKLVGNTEQQAKGLHKQVAGKAEQRLGDAKATVSDARDAIKDAVRKR